MTMTTTTTRWCPTPEQLMILEEMYRGGVRTPNATQIQHITAHLSLYGKIEGKNVFYWFQNHKARDRQKLRRRLAKHLHLQHQHQLLYYHPPPPPPFSHQIQTPDYNHQIFNAIRPIPIPNTNYSSCLSSPGGFQTHDYYASSSNCFMQPQLGDVSYEQAMSYTWNKLKDEEESSALKRHGDDWVVISSGFNSRPVKTLELFPITSPSCNINEEP
ncbi:hypothetical protein V2J09_007427 [Rumex salicifolius]